jgi:hypothetical protein
LAEPDDDIGLGTGLEARAFMDFTADVHSDHARLPGPRMLRPLTAAIMAIVVVASTMSLAPLASAATGDIGYEDQSYSGTSEPTGTKRAESVLWWNDGSWWANMWDTSTNDFHIFRLDLASQTWVDTGTSVDPRANSHADVLWAGGHLYIASHLAVSDENPAVSGYPSNLYRFSYSAATKTYTSTPVPGPDQQLQDRDAGHRPRLDRQALGDLAAGQQDLRQPNGRGRRPCLGHAVPAASGCDRRDCR